MYQVLPMCFSCSVSIHPHHDLKREVVSPTSERAVEMKLREASELVWGHTASEVWPDLPTSRAQGLWSSLVGTGKTWGVGFQLQG